MIPLKVEFCIQKGEKLSRFKESRFWRLTLLLTVFAMVVVACGGSDTAEETVEEAPAETAAPATTAAAAEEAAPSGPDGVFKMAVFSDLLMRKHAKTLNYPSKEP